MAEKQSVPPYYDPSQQAHYDQHNAAVAQANPDQSRAAPAMPQHQQQHQQQMQQPQMQQNQGGYGGSMGNIGGQGPPLLHQQHPQQQQGYGVPEGVAYQQDLLARCARGEHNMDTKYGIVGIIIAVICCPCGFIALCIDRKKVCTRCGHTVS